MIAPRRLPDTVDERRQVFVDRIVPDDLGGVPAGQRVYLALRIRCRDCDREVYLPARSRGADGAHVAYQVFAQRCPEHRRAYEHPAVVPRVRDAQRMAVYRWERRLPPAASPGRWTPPGRSDGNPGRQRVAIDRRGGPATLASSTPAISFEECHRLVESVWADLMPHDPYGPPDVVLARRRWRTSSANADAIKLAPTMLHPMTVLHELAHSAIGRWLTPGTYAAHGPEFAALYLSLLDEWLGLPTEVGRRLGESQRPRRLRFAESGFRPDPAQGPQLALAL